MHITIPESEVDHEVFVVELEISEESWEFDPVTEHQHNSLSVDHEHSICRDSNV